MQGSSTGSRLISPLLWLSPAILLWTLAIGWPALALAWNHPQSEISPRIDDSLLVNSLVWSAGIGFGSAAIGWVPGIVLGRHLQRRRLVLPILMLMPMCLPTYVIFTCWWQAVPPNSWLEGVAARGGWTATLRHIILAVGLLCWSWPIVAWSVSASRHRIATSVHDMLRIDNAGVVQRVLTASRRDWPGLLIGSGTVFLFTMSNVTCFDLAQVKTFGYELRTLDAQGGLPGDILRVALPAMVICFLMAITIWIVPRRTGSLPSGTQVNSRLRMVAALLILALSTVAPVALLLRNAFASLRIQEFLLLYGEAIANTTLMALAVGGCVALITGSMAVVWHVRHPLPRMLLAVLSLGFLAGICIPGVIPAIAIESAWNHPVVGPSMYDSPVGLLLGGIALTGFLAAWMSRACGRAELARLADTRQLDAATCGLPLLRAVRPRVVAAMVAAGAVAASLNLGEVLAAARLQRPGFDIIATSVLNAIHYQHPETVVLAISVMIIVGLAAAAVALLGWRPVARLTPILLFSLVIAGCHHDPSEVRAIPTTRVFGSVGVSQGQFNYPRAIDVNPRTGKVFVIDKSAHVQRFNFDGVCEAMWTMPALELGKPVGITVGPDDNLYVPDTHYHRVLVYDPDGQELLRFGDYGTEPGQFIYPTDIAFDGQGLIYVSEYGGNDRIQVFTPDGQYLRLFGASGDGPEQFSRPQSIAFSPDFSRLYVCDSCNHRIQMFSPDGSHLGSIGHVGRGPGEFSYPYGLSVLDNGDLLIAEFGNNRIQWISPDGESRGLWGGIGFDQGRVRYPWGIAVSDGTIFVLDSGNNRVQVARNL